MAISKKRIQQLENIFQKTTNTISEDGIKIDDLLDGGTFNNTSQDGELALLNQLLNKKISQSLTQKEITLTEILNLKTKLLDQERKHAERMQKMRLEQIKHQGFTLEEFTEAVAMIFKIAAKYIPEEKLPDFSDAIDTALRERVNNLKNKT